MKVQFAEQNRSCILQPPGDFRVRIGNAILEQLARSGRSNACRVDVVLQGNRHSVKRAAPPAALDLRLGLACRLNGLLPRYRDERIEGGIVFFDSPQAGLRQVDWRDRFGAQQIRRLLESQAGQIPGLSESGLYS